MRKTLALVLAVFMMVALFTGCGGKSSSGNATTDGNEQSTATSGTSSEGTPTDSEDSMYHYAKGNYATDENGFPTEKYAYDQPISTSDEVLTFWTVCWTPQLMPADGLGSLEYCKEQQEKTGVNIEYVVVDSNTRAENFATLLAADDLCDLSASGMSFYPGTVYDAVVNENYFVNIYDYKDYCPNYIYEAKMRDQDDLSTYHDVFYDDDLIYGFMALESEPRVSLASLIRSDWLDKINVDINSIVTWDDMFDVMCQFQSQIDTCTAPWAMLNVLDMQGSYTLNAFDTEPYVATDKLPAVYQVDGKVQFANTGDNDYQLMQMLNKFWNQGLICKDWAGKTTNSDYHTEIGNGEVGYIATNATSKNEYKGFTTDPNCEWDALPKIVRTEGQTIHVGEQRSRVSYGQTNISSKCENIPLAVSWCDWRYSDAGSFFVSYGVEGETWEYDANGNVKLTDFVLNNPDGVGSDWVMIVYTLDQLAEHGLEDVNRKYAFDGGDELLAMYDVWENFKYDGAYEWPAGLNLSDEQTDKVNSYSGDICTYISENYLAFMDGSKPLSEWDSYVKALDDVGLNEVRDIYQQAYDDYTA